MCGGRYIFLPGGWLSGENELCVYLALDLLRVEVEDAAVMNVSESFFRERSINNKCEIESAEDLWKWLTESRYCGLAGWRLDSGQNLFFRGQASIGFGLTSSLYRQCRSFRREKRVKEEDLGRAESAIISEMRRQGIGRRMTDGQLLMVLQHHGIPTRLLDVCGSPFESLFFATNELHRRDGCLFLIYPHGDREGNTLKLWGNEALPWVDSFGGGGPVPQWTSAVYLAPHKSLDPRMHAQNGQFLVGGLSRVYSGQKMRLLGVSPDQSGGESRVPVELVPDVSSLNLNFLKIQTREPNFRWGGTAWVLVVKAEWKEDLMEKLQCHDPEISPDTMYPPLGEVSRLARFVVDRELVSNEKN
ncbi:FRG domain-containing protein [Nocardiopsis sp. NRRL B-16309]|uniref:FRG domain-containing protein n=1 Tax=Nocardiopsis sp. NRRL B-16309 TaxID=1519494 RepID=UPI0009EAF5D2|nr:FRG domain-containing protein [Nocardiopsis sp. NRRL B-16309]